MDKPPNPAVLTDRGQKWIKEVLAQYDPKKTAKAKKPKRPRKPAQP